MSNDFKPKRALTDAKLAEILDNHAMLLNKLIGFARHSQRLTARAWRLSMTLAVLYLLFRGTVDASLVQLGALLSHIL